MEFNKMAPYYYEAYSSYPYLNHYHYYDNYYNYLVNLGFMNSIESGL